MEKQNKSTGKTVLIVLLLIVTIVSLVLATYAWAKYTTTESGSATAQVAKWNVTFESADDKFVGTYSHVVTNRIAPGTQGTFDVKVVPNDTEVCFDYTIKIDSVDFLGENDAVLPDSTILAEGVTLEDFRSHIKFTNEAGTDVTGGTLTSGTFDLSNHNTAPASKEDGTETFTWTWPYQLEEGTDEAKAAYDKIDTAAGLYSNSLENGLKMKVNYTVTAVQVKPQ